MLNNNYYGVYQRAKCSQFINIFTKLVSVVILWEKNRATIVGGLWIFLNCHL